jgi:hypothetical protein
MEGQLVRQIATLGDLDRVDLTDEVRDGDVGRGELLGVAPIARQPVDGGRVTVSLDDRLRRGTDGMIRVVVELTAADGRQPLPRKTRSCPARIAFSIAGRTVSS